MVNQPYFDKAVIYICMCKWEFLRGKKKVFLKPFEECGA